MKTSAPFGAVVLNISIGPRRDLIGKDGSGERAIQRAITYLIEVRGIPVVMSAGNDGPEPGLVNRWAPPGSFLATAANSNGSILWERSSRFVAPMPNDVAMFAADGIDTIGARAGCRPKSAEQEEADRRAHLADVVGESNVSCFEVASGTSYAAGNLTRSICLLSQALALLALKSNALTPIDQEIPIPPFVRAFIDSGFDRSHPVFADRLADARAHYGPMLITLSQAAKETVFRSLVGTGADVNIHYRPSAISALLRRAAAPMAPYKREQVGYGFISAQLIATMLTQLHFDDLVDALAEADPRRGIWVDRMRRLGNPVVFTDAEVSQIRSYCEKYDLVLGFPLFANP